MDDTELMLDVGQANEIKLAARRAGATNQDLKRLSEGDMFTRILPVLRNRPKDPTPQRELRVLGPIATRSTDLHRFKAGDTFFNQNSGVKMVPHGPNFTKWFSGKVEENVPSGGLISRPLIRPATDSEIIADLGGEEKAGVTLVEIWRLMQRQPSGEEGVLLTNGWANIFYVRDTDGVLRVVHIYWRGDGWYVGAVALGGSRWRGGLHVFSRDSCLR